MDGISLRADTTDAGTPASVTFPLAVLKDADSKKKETHKPFEYFMARLGVDDSSVPAGYDGSGAAVPAIITVLLDGKEVYASSPLVAPGASSFIRLPIKDAAKLTLQAKLVTDKDVADKVPAKTVITEARVVAARDFGWSTRRSGQLPSFQDAKDGAVVRDGAIAKPTTPLSLARFILSRLSFLAEAHSEMARKGAASQSRVARACGLEVTAGPAAIASAGEGGVAASAQCRHASPACSMYAACACRARVPCCRCQEEARQGQ